MDRSGTLHGEKTKRTKKVFKIWKGGELDEKGSGGGGEKTLKKKKHTHKENLHGEGIFISDAKKTGTQHLTTKGREPTGKNGEGRQKVGGKQRCEEEKTTRSD